MNSISIWTVSWRLNHYIVHFKPIASLCKYMSLGTVGKVHVTDGTLTAKNELQRLRNM